MILFAMFEFSNSGAMVTHPHFCDICKDVRPFSLDQLTDSYRIWVCAECGWGLVEVLEPVSVEEIKKRYGKEK